MPTQSAATRAASCDLGGVLGHTERPGVTAALAQASPRPAEVVATAVREHLYRAPVLTDAVIDAVARHTDLVARTVREIAEAPTRLQVDRLIRQILIDVHHAFPHIRWVINSNAAASSADHATQVQREYGSLFTRAYVSHRTGYAKGHDWQAFGQIADDLGVARIRPPAGPDRFRVAANAIEAGPFCTTGFPRTNRVPPWPCGLR